MKTLALLLLLAAPAVPARAAHPFADFQAAASGGSGLVTQAEGGTTFDKERYLISARVRTTRLGAEAGGTREEYALRMTRELYYLTVTGRLGTSPPSPQGAGYHFAEGEAWFKFYGVELGPEHPEISQDIWESSGPVPDPAALDRTWITRLGGVYTNINNHIQTPTGLFILVRGAWRFSLLETYMEKTTLGLQAGGNRNNKAIDGTAPVILLNTVSYWGNYIPVSGWPNNWQSLMFSRRMGPVSLTLAGTRLNLLDGGTQTMAGAEMAWSPSGTWEFRAGLERTVRRGGASRTALAFGASRRW